MTEMFDSPKDNTHSETAGWPKGKSLHVKLRYRWQNIANFIISRCMNVECISSCWVSKKSIILEQISHLVSIVRYLDARSVSELLAPFVAALLTHTNAQSSSNNPILSLEDGQYSSFSMFAFLRI
jgi:hypothetical protein